MRLFSLALTGFSIISTLILLFAYLFFLRNMEKTREGKIASVIMLLGLAALQICHLLYFVDGVDLLSSRIYCFLLALLPVSFWFFSREVLFLNSGFNLPDVIHIVPIICALILPTPWIPPVVFLVGAGYTLVIAIRIFKLRNHVDRFKFEMFFFGLFFIMALIALVLGLVLPFLEHTVFYFAYANSISVAIVLVVSALILFPDLLSDVLIITETAYSNSRLSEVNVDAKIRDLDRLMVDERQYEDENLNLSTLASSVGLSSHQLSELINTHYQYGFSRFVRVHRVEAAKRMLIDEPGSSVLSIGLSVGFKSQSSFYTAFKEVTGVSPGTFRQNAS